MNQEPEAAKIEYWRGLSQYDLDTAQALLVARRFLYVGFMCHQSIEKILKACYVKLKSVVPPHTHNLGRLAKDSGLLESMPEDKRRVIADLQPLNIEARYPSYRDRIIQSLTADRCEALLGETRDLHTWLTARL